MGRQSQGVWGHKSNTSPTLGSTGRALVDVWGQSSQTLKQYN